MDTTLKAKGNTYEEWHHYSRAIFLTLRPLFLQSSLLFKTFEKISTYLGPIWGLLVDGKFDDCSWTNCLQLLCAICLNFSTDHLSIITWKLWREHCQLCSTHINILQEPLHETSSQNSYTGQSYSISIMIINQWWIGLA